MSKLEKDIRIFLQRTLLNWFDNLECSKHVVGEVTYNEKGDAYSECRICDEEMTLVAKTLGEVDKMSLETVAKLLPKGETLDGLAKSANERSGLSK